MKKLTRREKKLEAKKRYYAELEKIGIKDMPKVEKKTVKKTVRKED